MPSLGSDYKMAYEFLYSNAYKFLSKKAKEQLEIILNGKSIMNRIPIALNKLKKNYGYGTKDS